MVEQIVTIVQRRVEMQFRYSGPLPWSGELRNYDEVVPGAADRIITMAEKQSEHRRALETAVTSANIASQRSGLIFAFVLALVGFLGGIGLVALGMDVAGLATVIGSVGGLAIVFIYGRRQNVKKLREKLAPLSSKTPKDS